MNTENPNSLKHPFELFGVECGPGWHPLLEPVIEYINKYNQDKDEDAQIKFTQIKEKWGALCIYTNFCTDELSKLIEKAEDDSYIVCEDCGSRKDVGMRISEWRTTMCLACIRELVREKRRSYLWRRVSLNFLRQ